MASVHVKTEKEVCSNKDLEKGLQMPQKKAGNILPALYFP